MTPRFHPLLRLFIAALGAVFAVALLTGVVFSALQIAAQMANRSATDAAAFANDNALLVTILSYFPALLWLWFCRRFFDRQSFVSLGLRARGAFSSAFSGAFCSVLTISFLFAILVICGFVRVNGFSSEFTSSGARAIGPLFSYFLVFCAVGFTEEVVFRGYTFHNLGAWLGVRGALWAQAILFGVIHLPNVTAKLDSNGTPIGILPPELWPHAFWDARWGILNIALIGAFFGLCYLKTGSLWFPIGFHAAWNFFLGCVFSLPVSGIRTFRVLDITLGANTTMNGGQFGAEGSVFLVAIVGAMLWLLRREPDNAQAFADLARLRPAIWTQFLESQTASAKQLSPDFLALNSSLSNKLTTNIFAPNSPDLNAETEEDIAHVSRFRTSMRADNSRFPSSRASLNLDETSAISSTRNAFTPQNMAAFPTPRVAPNSVVDSDSLTANERESIEFAPRIASSNIVTSNEISPVETQKLQVPEEKFVKTDSISHEVETPETVEFEASSHTSNLQNNVEPTTPKSEIAPGTSMFSAQQSDEIAVPNDEVAPEKVVNRVENETKIVVSKSPKNEESAPIHTKPNTPATPKKAAPKW